MLKLVKCEPSLFLRNKKKNENEINKYKGTKKQPRIRRHQHGRRVKQHPMLKKKKKQRNHGQNTKKHVTHLKEWSE
jgi:hypothetical protein